MPFRSEWQESAETFGSEKSLLLARIQELESLVKKEQHDRASAEANRNALNALSTQIQTIRLFFTPDEAYCSKISVCFWVFDLCWRV